jgi:hypothetical protein
LKQRLEATQPAKTNHPSTDMLLAFVEHGLSPGERGEVMSHLAVCSECRHAVALGTPEASPQNAAAAAAPKPVFPFPAAVRWVSLAAALAVGVGVGVVSYEHQVATGRHADDRHEAKTAALPEPPPIDVIGRASPQVSQGARSGDAAKAEAHNSQKKEFSWSTNGADGAIVRDSELKKGSIKRENLNPASNTVATNLDEARRSKEKDRTATTLANGFSNSPRPGYDKASGARDDNSVLQANASAAPISPPVSVGSATETVDVEASAPVAPTNDKSSAQRDGVMGGLEGGLAQTQAPSPAKALRSAAIGSLPAAKTSALEGEQFVAWNISGTGQLQRSSANGAVTTVEPVPGLTVRAVAANGIEVWAAGAQANIATPVLFHSSDAGETWIRVSGPWQSPIRSLNLAGKNNLSVMAVDGTWLTTDAGKSWRKR